jgi:ferrous iron transport protein B
MECCDTNNLPIPGDKISIALVGSPNVGKSVLFHRLTGRYVAVSNYPGTTVEVTHGPARSIKDATIVDTPGIVSFPPRSEDEAVTAQVLLNQDISTIVQVGDAKNLRRSLTLCLQLGEMGLPMILAMNMADEAAQRGMSIDYNLLGELLHLPVVPTIATQGKGVEDVEITAAHARRQPDSVHYPPVIEACLEEISPMLPAARISARALGIMWLSRDATSEGWIQRNTPVERFQQLGLARQALQDHLAKPAIELIQKARQEVVEKIVDQIVSAPAKPVRPFAYQLSRLTIHPLWGLPILALVLYAIYWFVGVFGAGTLVGLLEGDLFTNIINPWVTSRVQQWIPVPLIADFLVGKYGIWTIGITYAAALLLPIVTTFFITFGLLEDSGYLPRLSILSNRMFQHLGLNGKAVLPMVLGLGCVTMATITTRILESKRDRMLVILLLALAVPCSAQLGVVMGMLAGISLGAALIWGSTVLLILFAVGWLASRLLPGDRTPLLVELPPLRMPVFSNVLLKTLARLEWYVKEAVPLFIIGTVLLFVLDKIGVLAWLIKAGEPLITGWLGLPPDASAAFLLGFLRRDFAATGLFHLQSHGLLSPQQAVVSIVTITLFIPCIASLFMIVKERGAKTAAAMTVFIFPFAFLMGGLLNRLLQLVGWNG